jgi:hypothetical protein
MEPSKVVAKRKKLFELDILEKNQEDLRLPSLSQDPPLLKGHAFRFKVILPRLSQSGEEVFTGDQLRILHEVLDRRFGGSLASSDIPHPTWYGTYLPELQEEPVKDYHVIFYVYTRPVDAADRFFQELKFLLKRAGLQDEVLVEKIPVWLLAEAEPEG